MKYLKEPDEEHGKADGLHDAGVVVQQGLSAASPPQVHLLVLLVVVEVLGQAAELVLEAGPRGEGAAAAEGNAVHQVLPLHVTPQTAAGQKRVVNQELGLGSVWRLENMVAYLERMHMK